MRKFKDFYISRLCSNTIVSKVLPSHLMTRTKMVLKAIASIAMVPTKISLLTSHNS